MANITLSEEELCEIYETGIQLAKECGHMIKECFYRDKKVTTKASYADLVTETDQNVEKFFTKEIKKHYPGHSVIGEETTADGKKIEFTNNPTWIIDPIDGTTNFVHRIPYTCISIGLTVNKEPVIGIVYNPITDVFFKARKGHGAFCNDKKIAVTGLEEIESAMFIMEFGSNREPDKMAVKFRNLFNLNKASHGLRAYGSAALNMCNVAQGEEDGYAEHGIHCWDIAAGAVIVEEAGGVVIDPSGDKFDLMSRKVLVASSMPLALKMSALLEDPGFERD
ncbi:inositol monophosphatase 1-like [Octopus vulgaris]|uniref:Inositol monophosphatase 1-like n=2 Tax=Octopus TaxID=6643 RepID=A0AA36ASC9_OCTVU|nr:inositol monophosphatase 1 [Octopus sinensis]XP_029634087.1 inositol monophosphatase 1 [Octopus sinensis]CAI9719927.1 inositol monophosphatase 1-like [Octopus vulgaris]